MSKNSDPAGLLLDVMYSLGRPGSGLSAIFQHADALEAKFGKEFVSDIERVIAENDVRAAVRIQERLVPGTTLSPWQDGPRWNVSYHTVANGQAACGTQVFHGHHGACSEARAVLSTAIFVLGHVLSRNNDAFVGDEHPSQ